MDGDSGTDTARYSPAPANCEITRNDDGSSTISQTGGIRRDGTDRLVAVEEADFGGTIVAPGAADGIRRPVAPPGSVSPIACGTRPETRPSGAAPPASSRSSPRGRPARVPGRRGRRRGARGRPGAILEDAAGLLDDLSAVA